MTDRTHTFTLFTSPDKSSFFFESVTFFDSGTVAGDVITGFKTQAEAIEAMKWIADNDEDCDDEFPYTIDDDPIEDLVDDFDSQFVATYESGFFKR